MAAFFTINIAEFKRDGGGNLSLGYVSSILCKFLISSESYGCKPPRPDTPSLPAVPISITTSVLLITIAFQAKSWTMTSKDWTDLKIPPLQVGWEKAVAWFKGRSTKKQQGQEEAGQSLPV